MFLKFCSKNSKFSKNDIFSKSFGKFVRSVKNCRFSSSLEQSYIVRFFSFLLKKLTFLISLNNPIRSSFVRRFFSERHPIPRKISFVLKNVVLSKNNQIPKKSVCWEAGWQWSGLLLEDFLTLVTEISNGIKKYR